MFGVSYDSPEVNHTFATENRLPFRLLSDRDRSLARGVGAERLLLPVPKRISFLVGRDGTVLEAYPKVSPSRHARQVLRDIRELTNSQ